MLRPLAPHGPSRPPRRLSCASRGRHGARQGSRLRAPRPRKRRRSRRKQWHISGSAASTASCPHAH
eukprot:1715674-Alexandrium_andersonii.AAC.1